MNDRRRINVYSEIGKLKTVMLHRPGAEIENLIPEYLERLLFDDIPYLKVARDEHDKFADILRTDGVEVLYLEKLVADSLKDSKLKEKFLDEVLAECKVKESKNIEYLKDFLKSMPTKAMVDKVMAGVRRKEINLKEDVDQYPFIMDPMPNLYFTRDPFACIGNGISLNHMRTVTRRRETIFGKYIFNHHPEYKESGIPQWYHRDGEFAIEGGDQLILSKEVLAVGYSERTDKEAVFKLAENIFKSGESFNTVLIFDIPKTRAFMHLDTVFTMIDHDMFTVHPGIEGELKVIALTYNHKNKKVIAEEEEGTLEKILSKHLNIDAKLIRCGNGDRIIAGREQWNDGSNTLAISPGKVVTYERNYITNEILDKNNITVLAIPSSELSRGRGGPRCMSMPFYRENL